MKKKLHVAEVDLTDLVDVLTSLKVRVLNRTNECCYYRPDEKTGNLSKDALDDLLRYCLKVRRKAIEVLELLRCCTFELFERRLLYHAHKSSDQSARTITFPNPLGVDLAVIGNGTNPVAYHSDFKTDNVIDCDSIVMAYTEYISTASSVLEGVRSGYMPSHIGLISNTRLTTEHVLALAPTNNSDYCVSLINTLEDYIHKELLRGVRTMPETF